MISSGVSSRFADTSKGRMERGDLSASPYQGLIPWLRDRRSGMEFEIDEGRFTWDGKNWYQAGTFMRPPKAIEQTLNAAAAEFLAKQDEGVTDANELLSRARSARDSGQTLRAEKLLDRVLCRNPNHEGALAILCSLLRRLGRAEEAIRRTDRLASSSYPPLLTTRAAAFCDVFRWEDAKKTIARVLAQPGNHGEAFEVVNRIKAARSELYSK